jgi:hypothetical protein
MISYPEANYVKRFLAEAFEKTRDLPPYNDGPAVDYTNAPHAYALNATLLHDPRRTPKDILTNGPSAVAEILLVERASGHGEIGSFSGVSGYIDTLQNPNNEADTQFDPIAHTLKEELETECGFTEHEFGVVDFHAGMPTVELRTRTPGAKITVIPILGLCHERPEVVVNKDELASHRWVGLAALKAVEQLARGYRTITLPSALGAIGLKGEAFFSVLNLVNR